ncbi:MAG TPA: hypothetical protein VFG81_01515 [Anaerolineales bacterium]|jgi:hypothetical protein|nr:hypothetical protein [Anaerolineales bacterium]
MSDWKRRTQEVAIDALPAQAREAVERHIEQYNLGPILLDVLMCIQTESEKVKKGLFGKAESVQMTVILTPRWLLWSVDQPNKNTAVLSAQLIHITVQDYSQTPFAKLIPDSGVEVSGMFTDASEPASLFIGLEESAAGQAFRQSLIRATADAKK